MIFRPPTQPAPPEPTPPLRPGANVLMGRNQLGCWINGPSTGGGNFSHPFTVYVGGGMVRVSKGLVLANIAVEPVIGKVPIGGDTKNPQPTLKLDVSLVDHLKQSWICLEVTPDNDGKLDEKMATSRVEVRQWGGPIKIDGPTGRTPLAMLLLVNNSWRVLQIAMFHFRYETVQTSNGPRRHFFS